ncbi:MAG: hypothetical protein J6D11_04675 [Clostridia bacterium]|nr:hypothetical protein [Clostridia bacterium]
MPYCPSDSRDDDDTVKVRYKIHTFAEKLVSEYTGFNFAQIEELPIDVYYMLLRDAFIYKQSQTKEGREYLEECWILEQTEPDRETLRDHFEE